MNKFIFFFEKLPPGYRERAILRFEESTNDSYGRGDVRGLPGALDYAFAWRETKEGFSFWHDLHAWTRIPETYPLPPLPPL